MELMMESRILAVEVVFAARSKGEEPEVRNGADNFNKQGKCLTGPTKPPSSQHGESFSFQLMQGCMQQQHSILAKIAMREDGRSTRICRPSCN
jgi:hypothetical protein